VFDHVYRVGVENSPPHMVVDPDGSVKGLVIEVLQEAARRRGLRLQWVPIDVAGGLDASLADGVVDMWGNVGYCGDNARAPSQVSRHQ
jgi:hypothetical protein